MDAPATDQKPAREGLFLFCALACGVTWALALPATSAWLRHQTPGPGAVACAGLSAFGPTLAALAIALPQRTLGDVFGRWRSKLGWGALGLAMAPAVNLVSTALYALTGGHPDAWFHPPLTPEHYAALVVFPLGEEFGWRGFLQPRASARFGALKGALLVGFVWGLWHLAYSVTPVSDGFDTALFAMTMVELTLYALPFAWLFERSNRSMAVAIAAHVGAHADHLERVPLTNLHLHGVHMAVVVALAVVAGRALNALSVASDGPRGAAPHG